MRVGCLAATLRHRLSARCTLYRRVQSARFHNRRNAVRDRERRVDLRRAARLCCCSAVHRSSPPSVTRARHSAVPSARPLLPRPLASPSSRCWQRLRHRMDRGGGRTKMKTTSGCRRQLTIQQRSAKTRSARSIALVSTRRSSRGMRRYEQRRTRLLRKPMLEPKEKHEHLTAGWVVGHRAAAPVIALRPRVS